MFIRYDVNNVINALVNPKLSIIQQQYITYL